VSRVDKVVAVAGVHLVVASSPSPGMISSLPPPSIMSSPPRPVRRSSRSVPTRVSSPPVPVRAYTTAFCPAKNAPTITIITVRKMYSRFIRLPPLVYVELVLLVFSRTYQEILALGISPPWLAVPYVTGATIAASGPGAISEDFRQLRFS
jgi:hypothetical protein